MAARPVATPVTDPVAALIVAMPGLPLLHVPDGVGSVKVTEEPWHTSVDPDIVDGRGFAVTIAVTLQPAPVE